MMSNVLHQKLAAGSWSDLSLMAQMANIGSEVGRAAKAQYTDKKRFKNAADRALDLFDLTLKDARWRGRRLEIARARELFCAAIMNDDSYVTSLRDLEHYFMQFAAAIRH